MDGGGRSRRKTATKSGLTLLEKLSREPREQLTFLRDVTRLHDESAPVKRATLPGDTEEQVMEQTLRSSEEFPSYSVHSPLQSDVLLITSYFSELKNILPSPPSF